MKVPKGHFEIKLPLENYHNSLKMEKTIPVEMMGSVGNWDPHNLTANKVKIDL